MASVSDPSDRSDRTRRNILEAASTLFDERGLSGVSVRDVAAAAGVSTRTVTRHFPELHQLFAEVVRLSSGSRLPVNALIVVGVGAAVLPFVLPDRTAYVLGGASAVPLLIALFLPVIGLIRARRRGEWHAGPWGTGRWVGPAAAVTAVALAALAVDIVWPHVDLYNSGIAAWRPLMILAAIVVVGLILMAWALRDGGIHVRNHDHVDRDLHERILLAHSGTCSMCHRALAVGEEVFWNPEAHVTICVACDEDVVV